ncbi:MAG: DUF192 domain-containing protein [Ignavibacteria bacterium]|nr:DUF192 domain-containing protein [Ignavibacteria bacterium]
MSKQKVKRKGPARKNLFVQITVVVVLLGFVIYFILSNFILNKPSATNSDLERAMKNKMTYTFQKEGELVFTNHNGDTISKIDIEIADDDQQRELGLMMRRSMNEDNGMLFLFPYETIQAFWMKNTIIPLDILYVNSQNEIVKIYKNTEPYSEKSLPSEKPAIYVVEVNGGYTDKYGIKEGDKIIWKRN